MRHVVSPATLGTWPVTRSRCRHDAQELPHGFRRKRLAHWLAKIPSERSRTLTAQKLDALLARSSTAQT